MVQKIERVEITNDLCIEMISWKKDLQSHCKCNVIVISKNDGFRVIIYASENYILANYLVNIGIGLVVLHVIKLSVSPP